MSTASHSISPRSRPRRSNGSRGRGLPNPLARSVDASAERWHSARPPGRGYSGRSCLGAAPLVLLALLLAGSVRASEPLPIGRSRCLARVNSKGEALVTYVRADGSLRHVLVWGAVNALPPVRGVPQVSFHFDYAGGWGKYRDARYWRRFRSVCRPYEGPQLAWLVAACTAPDGTHWALQAWQRFLPHRGYPPWQPAQAARELRISHWSGELPGSRSGPTGRSTALRMGCSAGSRTTECRCTDSARGPTATRPTRTAAASTSTPSTRPTVRAGSARPRLCSGTRAAPSVTASGRRGTSRFPAARSAPRATAVAIGSRSRPGRHAGRRLGRGGLHDFDPANSSMSRTNSA